MSIKRAEKRREAHENKMKELHDRGVKHYGVGDRPPTLPRMPKTQREMQMHLSGKRPELFRDPVNRAERREWDRYWKLKGRGFTKPEKSGERF